mmetsp:Transcript_75303/g.207743  ORF Transcript_75303/g.207743 Transcript_75303/m.207743 type:complete len:511 (+) Transcript_75303:230-1762(+)
MVPAVLVEGAVLHQVAVARSQGWEDLRVRVPQQQQHEVAEVPLQLPPLLDVVHLEAHEGRRGHTQCHLAACLVHELERDPLLPAGRGPPRKRLRGQVCRVDARAQHQLLVLRAAAGHELLADLVVVCHVRVQDALDDGAPQGLLRRTVQPCTDGRGVLAQQLARQAGVVVLEHRDVVVPECQLAVAVHHEGVREAGVAQVVAQRRDEQAEDVERTQRVRKGRGKEVEVSRLEDAEAVAPVVEGVLVVRVPCRAGPGCEAPRGHGAALLAACVPHRQLDKPNELLRAALQRVEAGAPHVAQEVPRAPLERHLCPADLLGEEVRAGAALGGGGPGSGRRPGGPRQGDQGQRLPVPARPVALQDPPVLPVEGIAGQPRDVLQHLDVALAEAGVGRPRPVHHHDGSDGAALLQHVPHGQAQERLHGAPGEPLHRRVGEERHLGRAPELPRRAEPQRGAHHALVPGYDEGCVAKANVPNLFADFIREENAAQVAPSCLGHLPHHRLNVPCDADSR